MKQYDLVLSGLGGQGVMSISKVLAAAALREDMHVTLLQGTGIAQRGGSVFGFVRFGEHASPKIPRGRAHAIVCLEISEVANVIGYLKPEGRIWTSSGKVHDYYTKLNPGRYPARENIEALIKSRTSQWRIMPAHKIAREAGAPQAVNMVMLGALAQNDLPVTPDAVKWAIQKTTPKYAASNLKAFLKGYAFLPLKGSTT